MQVHTAVIGAVALEDFTVFGLFPLSWDDDRKGLGWPWALHYTQCEYKLSLYKTEKGLSLEIMAKCMLSKCLQGGHPLLLKISVCVPQKGKQK